LQADRIQAYTNNSLGVATAMRNNNQSFRANNYKSNSHRVLREAPDTREQGSFETLSGENKALKIKMAQLNIALDKAVQSNQIYFAKYTKN
jgi:hypothetical protein